MHKFNLAVEYTVTNPKDKEGVAALGSTRGISLSLIRGACTAKYHAGPPQQTPNGPMPAPGGIKDPKEKKTWARIERLLMRAEDKKRDIIPFEQGELDAIKDVLIAWQTPTGVMNVWAAELLCAISGEKLDTRDDDDDEEDEKADEKAEPKAHKNGVAKPAKTEAAKA